MLKVKSSGSAGGSSEATVHHDVTLGPLGIQPGASERRMQRLTWVVVSGAFLLWVVLAALGGVWVSTTLQTAAAAAPSSLQEAGGIVLYREVGQPNETSARVGTQLYERDELTTAIASSATVKVFDNTLFRLSPNTRLQVNASRIGRWNPAATQAVFTLSAGSAHLTIPDEPNKAHTVNVVTPHGGAAFVPGEYTLRVGPEGTRFSVSRGRLAAAIGAEIIEVGEGQKLVLGGGGAPYAIVPRLEDVVSNGDFSQLMVGWEPWEVGEPERPDSEGRRAVVRGEGPGAPSQVLRLSRVSERDAHNETGLRQLLGRDVQGANAIILTARLRLDFASLSGGGYLGSEYPLMLRVRYRDAREGLQAWTQGFYYANPENRPVQIGQRIERGMWTDIAIDLTQLSPAPARIDALEVFGAGHTFDASVGDLRLLVD